MKFFVKSQTPEEHSYSAQENDRHTLQSSDPRLQLSVKDLVALRNQANGFVLNPAMAIKNQFIGRHSSRHRGRGLNFEELAHYRQGDDIRTMDWKVTHRTRKPHVRVFTEERERPVMLACDQRQGMMFGSHQKLKSVVAGEVFALLAWRQLKLGDAVASLIFGDQDVVEARPHRSQHMLLRDFKTLATINQALISHRQINTGALPTTQLSTVLSRLSRLCARDYLIVLISDMHDLDKNAAQQIKSLALYNDVFVAQITDPIELALPSGKQFIASNGAMQLAVNTNDKLLTGSFNTHQQQRVEQLRRTLQSAGVVHIELNTIDESYRQLRRCISDNTTPNGNIRQKYQAKNA